MDFKLIYLARRNPSIRAEDWPRTWRSHAVFASQFPVIGARLTSLFYCNRVVEPTLDGAAFEPPGASRDYDGVAIVSSDAPVKVDMEPEARAKIDQDELRVFATYTPNFAFHCKETLVYGGAPGAAAIIRFLARRPDSSHETFLAHFNGRHADMAQRAVESFGAVTRYVHEEVTEEPPPGYPFDGITETWFANTDDAVRSFVDGAFATFAKDSPVFCDQERSVTMLTSVIHRWPRA